MSFDAIRWAMNQAFDKALTKFCLVAMADCVNAEAGTWEFFASYAHLSKRTGMNAKTVESAVYSLRQKGYIVDTGRRAGETGKVVIYRLNDPANGGIPVHSTTPDANGTRPLKTPENGVIGSQARGSEIPPNPTPNPPKNTGQSPQIPAPIPPKTGDGTSKGTRKKPGLEPGDAAAFAALIDVHLVPPEPLNDWLKVRRAKRAPLTASAINGLVREASVAGITVADAVRMCAENNWQSFQARFLAERSRPHSAFPTAQERRVAEAVPGLAARRDPPPRTPQPLEVIDDVTPRRSAIPQA
ncbi:hypothetical protein [Ramlibacter sp.]|uniref:hypothetical protein n=1 Tax=Ramlibacter sp. TaxID=1917967 RepID=UPI003D0B5821